MASLLAFHMDSGYPNHVTMLIQQGFYALSHLPQSVMYTLGVSYTFQNLFCDLAIIKVLIIFLFGIIVLFISEFSFLELYIQYTLYLLKTMSRLLLASLPKVVLKMNPVIHCCV